MGMLLNSYMVSSAIPQAAPLPATTTEISRLLSSTFNTVTTPISLPAGDWAVCGFFSLKSSALSTSSPAGVIFTLSTSGGVSRLSLSLSQTTGQLYMAGTDDAGNTFGAYPEGPTANASNPNAIFSDYALAPEKNVFIVCQKVGNLVQLWLKYDGHAPVLAAEAFTNFGACAAQTFRFGRTNGNGGPLAGRFRRWGKFSYSFTKDQIDQIGNGVLPTSLGTPGANDFYFPFQEASTTSWASTINGMSCVATASTAASEIFGYASQTEAVFLNPIGPEWTVKQQVNGTATLAISGTYRGTDGAAIQVQVLDDTNTAFMGWQQITANATGNVWSGNITLPKKKTWMKFQMRKVIAGVPSTDVMTTTMRFGVGENIILDGQSLMDYQRAGSAPYGSSGITASQYVSFQNVYPAIQSAAFTSRFNISTITNAGGLIRVGFASKHGRRTGEKIAIGGVVGTVEANDRVWPITVTSPTEFTLDGSVFVNAYISGGFMYINSCNLTTYTPQYQTIGDGHAIIGNMAVQAADSVVCIANKAVSGTSIANHMSWSGNTAPYTILTGLMFGRVGWFLWQQGNNDLGLSPIRSYFADGGVAGAWTGFGLLGMLKTFYETNWPNADFKMGVVPFTSQTGITGYSADIVQQFRHGMYDWCVRKIAAGDTNVFPMGWQHDFQPQLESNGIGAHQCPEFKGQKSAAARIAQDFAKKIGYAANDSFGPSITSASRTGAVVRLNVAHNGGSVLRTLAVGARPSGFEVSTNTSFSSKLAISNVQIINSTTIDITLASDPGVTVYVRYMYGKVGDYTNAQYGNALVTSAADNGAGLIRLGIANSPSNATLPSGYQKTGGVGLPVGNNGAWVRVSGVRGATQANGYWQVNVIDENTIDLIGSSSVGIGTFLPQNIWGSGGSAVVEIELAIPVYDDRTIGGVDTNGAPLQPTYTYLTAA